MKCLLLLALALPSLAVCAQAQDPDVPLIDDLSPARKASAETRDAPRLPKPPAEGASKKSKPVIPGDSDRAEEPMLSEMPKDLSAAVSRALERNPQVLIADAKLRQAQAELSEAKFKVVSKVTAAFRDYARYKQMLADVQNPNSASDDLRRQIRREIEASELDLIYLLGIGVESSVSSPEQGGAGIDENNFEWNRHQSADPRQTMYESIRQQFGTSPAGPADLEKQQASAKKHGTAEPSSIPALLHARLAEKTVLDFEDQSLEEAVAYLGERHSVQFILSEKQINVPVTCNVHDVSLAAALQAIADLTNYCFVFRDYGILVVERGHALDYMKNHVPMIAPGERSPLVEEANGERDTAVHRQ